MSRAMEIIWREILPGSPLFTTSQVTQLARMDVRNVSRDLPKLADDGLVTRVRRGLWAVSGHPDFSPYAVVPHLFEEEDAGYVSFFTALHLHGMIEQIPQLIEVATRINKKSLDTPFGTYQFHQLQPELYDGWIDRIDARRIHSAVRNRWNALQAELETERLDS